MGVLKRVVKPVTHKGKKILKAREPKLIEDPKQTIFLKGRKTCETIQHVLKDLYNIKNPGCILLNKHHDFVPFENEVQLENIANKHKCSLFMFGSNTKKRPNNLVVGRTYDGHVLDMFEFEVLNFQSLDDFKNEKIARGLKPCLIFSGPQWEQTPQMTRIKSLLIDTFHREVVEAIRLQGLEHVINFIITPENKILVRSYKVLLKKSGSKIPRVELEEIGPSFDLGLRRTKEASEDLFKRALRQPKELKPTPKRNITVDKLGTKHGRIHLGKQPIRKIQTRKMKGLKKVMKKTSPKKGKNRKKAKKQK